MFAKNSLLRSISSENRWKLAGVYTLTFAAELGNLMIPAAAGMMINTFMSGEGYGVTVFVVSYLIWQGLGVMRNIFDTVVFTKIYNQVALRVVDRLQDVSAASSTINARLELLKQIVNFFEGDLPFLFRCLVAMIGTAILLFFYSPSLAVVCVVIVLPSLVSNYFFGRAMRRVATQTNNNYERQVEIIERGDKDEFNSYLDQIRNLNIRKSNLQAANYGIIEMFVLLMIVISLYIVCQMPRLDFGSIVAIYGYVLRFAYSFDFLHHLTERIATISDILDRLNYSEESAG